MRRKRVQLPQDCLGTPTCPPSHYKNGVKMTSSCSTNGKAIQRLVRKQNNCPTFGDESTSSGIPTASFVFIYTSEGLRTADCRMRCTNHWVENTVSGVKLLTKNSLLTECLVSYLYYFFFFIYLFFF